MLVLGWEGRDCGPRLERDSTVGERKSPALSCRLRPVEKDTKEKTSAKHHSSWFPLLAFFTSAPLIPSTCVKVCYWQEHVFVGLREIK